MKQTLFDFPAITRKANIIARQNGFGRATEILLGYVNQVIDSTAYGYRKYTTGEYVSNAYRRNFGWKNTYYQHAECSIEIADNMLISFLQGKDRY